MKDILSRANSVLETLPKNLVFIISFSGDGICLGLSRLFQHLLPRLPDQPEPAVRHDHDVSHLSPLLHQNISGQSKLPITVDVKQRLL